MDNVQADDFTNHDCPEKERPMDDIERLDRMLATAMDRCDACRLALAQAEQLSHDIVSAWHQVHVDLEATRLRALLAGLARPVDGPHLRRPLPALHDASRRASAGLPRR